MPSTYAAHAGGGPVSPPTTASEEARRDAAAAPPRRREAAQVAAGVVHPDDERAQRRVADHRHRRGSTTMRWKASRCMPRASARIALITSPCETATQTACVAVLGAHSGVVLADRGDRALLHGRHRLARRSREGHRRGVRLDDPPERLLGQLLEAAAGPVAVAALPQPLVGAQRRTPGRRRGRPAAACAVSWHRSSGLATTPARGSGGQPLPEGGDLVAAGVVQPDPGGPAGQGAARRWPRSGRGARAGRWAPQEGSPQVALSQPAASATSRQRRRRRPGSRRTR